jgi:hypothetical protein
LSAIELVAYVAIAILTFECELLQPCALTSASMSLAFWVISCTASLVAPAADAIVDTALASFVNHPRACRGLSSSLSSSDSSSDVPASDGLVAVSCFSFACRCRLVCPRLYLTLSHTAIRFTLAA